VLPADACSKWMVAIRAEGSIQSSPFWYFRAKLADDNSVIQKQREEGAPGQKECQWPDPSVDVL